PTRECPAGWVGHSLFCRLAESLRAARLSTNLARTSVLSAYSGQLCRLTTCPPLVGPPRPTFNVEPPGRDKTSGPPGQSSFRGIPATAGSLRGFPADSRAGSARDEEKPAVGMSKTYTVCRGITGATGLEPATSGVTGRRSNQLNYAPRANRSVARRCP